MPFLDAAFDEADEQPPALDSQVGVDSPLNPRHPAGVAAQRFGERPGLERSGARLLAVTLFAPAALGLVMTVTLLPIFIGLPLLLLFGRPWWVSWRVARGRASFGRAARVHLLVAATAWTLGWLGSAVVGFDDLDSTQDTALWALVVLPYSTVMWIGTFWVVAAPGNRGQSPSLSGSTEVPIART